MIKKPQIVVIMFAIAVFALIATGIKSPATGASFEKLTEEEATARWMTSGHGDSTSEAFRHWDEDDPAVVATGCAKCHSTDGFEEFIATGGVATEYPAANDIGVECTVCHSNPATGAMRGITSVTFPSGIFVDNLGSEAICMQCHQGRESTTRIESDIAAAKAAATGAFDDDTVSSKLRFRNVHYAVAGATNMGTFVKGGAEYPGKTYDARFSHVDGYNACATCHDPHTLEVRLDHCATCHTDPANTSYWGGIADAKNIRYLSSCFDYDGDGDMSEGIYYEIDTLKHILWDKISAYALAKSGTGIVHGDGYPYFFKDTNGNGVADESEQVRANAFASFTVRLTRALYNFQFASKDHGAFAHGGKYVIQLLVDGIEDLNTGLGEPAAPDGITRDGRPSIGDVATKFRDRVPQSAASSGSYIRVDEGHFDGSSESWRHWDEDGSVQGSCAKCHSATGLADYLDNSTIDDTHLPANGMLCTTCHTSPPGLRSAPAVTFPSGAILSMGDSSNLCLECHQGRASKNTIDAKAAGTPPFSASNIHYFPAAAILFGTEAKGAYEYEGKAYAGKRVYPNHNGRFGTCVQCHMGSVGLCDDCPTGECDHNVQKPNPADCVLCHGFDSSQPNPGNDPALFKFSGIRPGSSPDYNANGNTEEALKNEITVIEAALYAQILSYSANVLGTPAVYEGHTYPYWFKDKNGNGIADGPGEANYGNQFRGFDAKLLKAAYNYQASLKEPHGYIHNSRYVAQFLVDSIEDLGGDVSMYTWR